MSSVPPVQSGSVGAACHTGEDASSKRVGMSPTAVRPIARLIASSSGTRSNGNSRSARSSVTTTAVTSESTRGRARRAGTGVTKPIHNDESLGLNTGTGIRRRVVRPASAAYIAIISAYETTFGPPISMIPESGSGCSIAATRYRRTSRIEIGWQRVCTHFGVTITGSTSVR